MIKKVIQTNQIRNTVQYDGTNVKEIQEFTELLFPVMEVPVRVGYNTTPFLRIAFDGSQQIMNVGDWIIRYTREKFEICSNSSFKLDYKEV